MNIGICMHDAAPGTLSERAGFIREQGFSCVHLALSKTIDPKLMGPAAATPGLAAQVKHDLGDIDLAVLGCYLNLTHPDENAYRDILKRYRAHIQLARWMNAGCVGTETGNPNAGYTYDPARSHTPEALEMFIRRAAPVVECAEHFGVTLAIEPVYTHIVHDGKAARKVLDAISSDNLKIILDPVNLLHNDNVDRRDTVIREAIDLLGDDVVIIHMKDYQRAENGLQSMACGLGEMDYTDILRFAKYQKPFIQMTLEDTKPDNAEAARLYLEQLAETL
jgi:sugar phosphate isomerase/epimerase